MKGGRKFLGVKQLLSSSQALWSGIGLRESYRQGKSRGWGRGGRTKGISWFVTGGLLEKGLLAVR